jgi:hypothetical protein
MKINEIISEAIKQRLDAKCWKGKHKAGTKIKGGIRVNNCVPNESQGVAEGLDQEFNMQLAKILKQRGYKGPVKLEQLGMKWVEAIGDIVDIDDYTMVQGNDPEYDGWVSYVFGLGKYAYGAEQGYTTGTAKRVEIDTKHEKGVAEATEKRCMQCGMKDCKCPGDSCKCKPIAGWEPGKGFKKASIDEDWNKVNKRDKTDGLSQKAVNAYRRENPGSKLKTAVTTKPSKLKAGSKDAKRRKSFCARMSGNKGPMKDEKGRPTPKAKALSRWNCEE